MSAAGFAFAVRVLARRLWQMLTYWPASTGDDSEVW